MRHVLFSCALAGVLSTGTAWSQQGASIPGQRTVTIKQSVLADGKPLPAGTYQVRVTNERPQVGAGTPSDAQRVVEFTQNGQVVARVIAEVFPSGSPQAIGTSGTAGAARVETLRGGEFVRVSFNEADGRYLIHLPTGPLNEPAPQPQSPSRIELVSPPNPPSAPNQPGATVPPANPTPQPPSNRP